MLTLVALLTFVASASSADVPQMWGSRVVGKESGPSDPMIYEYKDNFRMIIINETILGTMAIKRNQCLLWEIRPWGRPCSRGPGYVNITLNNVTAQTILEMDEQSARPRLASTTFFVPRCNFKRPAPGDVDVWTSFPLSRFVKGTPWFRVDFAVGGADDDSTATFAINATPYCFWRRRKLLHKGADFCADMERDERRDLRIFRGVFPRKSDVSREGFVFAGLETALVVSIDYSQSGTSPEVAECSQYGRSKDLATLIADRPRNATNAALPTLYNLTARTSSGHTSTLDGRVLVVLLVVVVVL